MKIRRFFARDMRTALADVSKELGADAVILSSRRIGGGVELLAAVDYDPTLLAQGSEAAGADSAPLPPSGQPEQPPFGDRLVAPARKLSPAAAAAANDASLRAAATAALDTLAAGLPRPSAGVAGDERRTVQIEWGKDPGINHLRDELRQLRGLVEEQLQGLAWQDTQRRHPLRAVLARHLSYLELSPKLREHYAGSEGSDGEQALANAYAAIARDVVNYRDDPISDGGVIALVGPTGVGKTTTAAKLAARCALRHGANQVALISADSYRIGAHDQLGTFARLIGCTLRTVSQREDLGDTLDSLVSKRLIIIDCTGMSQRDARLAEELAALNTDRYPIKRLLVLSATAQRGAMMESVKQFSKAGLHGCVLTKMDEATSLGAALSTLVETRLPLAFLCDGQRVPEDLRSGRGVLLMDRALKLAEQYRESVDEWQLAQDHPRQLAAKNGTEQKNRVTAHAGG